MDIVEFLNDVTASTLAKEISDVFTGANSETLFCEFDLSSGKMASCNANTWFEFDVPKGTLLNEFKLTLFQRNLPEEEKKQLDQFLLTTAKMLADNHADKLRNTIRSVLMPQSTSEVIPMEEVVIKNLEISDVTTIPEMARYLFRITTEPGAGYDRAKVLERLNELREETALGKEMDIKDIKEIFEAHRHEDVFNGVVQIEGLRKYLYDASLALFVDYAPNESLLSKH